MAKYKLYQKSYLKSAEDMVEMVHLEGDVIDVAAECPPGPHWEPLDDEAKAAVAHFRAHPELTKPRNVDHEFNVQFAQAPGGNIPKIVPVTPESQNRGKSKF